MADRPCEPLARHVNMVNRGPPLRGAVPRLGPMPVTSPYVDALATIPVREAELDVLGSRTRYWEYGPLDRPVDLVLVHGFRGDHHGLESVISQLPGLRIVSPDIPGFGASTAMDGTHSVQGYGLWLRAFLDALDLVGTPLLGHSFGSIVVSHAVASGVPASRVILVNPIAADAMSGAYRALVPLSRLYFHIGRLMSHTVATAWYGMPLVTRIMSLALIRTKEPALRRWIHDEHRRSFAAVGDVRALAESYDASLSTNVIAAAGGLGMDTLLIAGEQDHVAPIEGTRRLAALVPHAELLVLSDVGHLIHYEKPVEAAAAIRTFLEAGS